MQSDDAPHRRVRHPHTAVVAAGRPSGAGQPLNVPIVLASTFRAAPGPTPTGTSGREYARDDGTANWEALEEVVGELEGGSAVAFSSGMAAAASVFDLLPAGSKVVAPTDCYSGVQALIADGEEQQRWIAVRVDITDNDAVLAAAADADLLWLESPTNPLLEVADLPALCQSGTGGRPLVAVDNTFATPLLQNPLSLGADVVVHSATKFIGGHSDLLLGLTVADAELAARLRRRREVAGATPRAMETFLAVPGVRTMAVRLEHGQRSAGELARRLSQHPAVRRVRYPGLPEDPGHDRAVVQMKGFGAVLSFELVDAAFADAVCDGVQVISSATSLGGVERTMERRAKLPGQEHVPPGLLRLSVGCEHLDDLWEDLTTALSAASGKSSVDDGVTRSALRGDGCARPARRAAARRGGGAAAARAPDSAPLRDDGGVLPPRTPSAVHDGCCLRGGASAALAVQPSAGCRGQCPVAARRLMRTARAGRAGPARGASRAAFRPRRPAPRQARASPAGSAMRPARAAQPPRRPARGRRHRQGLRRWLVRRPIGASCVEVAAPPRPHEMSATTGIVHLALPDRPWVDTDAGLRCVFLPSAAWRYARTSGGGSGQRPSGRRTVAGLVEHHRGRVADGRCVVPARTTRPAGPARRRAANFGGTGRGIATILALVS